MSANARHLRSGSAALALTLSLTTAARAAEPVDVELVLAVDVSLSMSAEELEIQRHGYAAALTHESVLRAIAGGAYGKIAVTYVEWAGTHWQRVVVPWTVIAALLLGEGLHMLGSSRADLFAESSFQGTRRVIDISGDGPNNQGAPVAGVRDEVVGEGIVINGLPLMTRAGFSSGYDIGDLDRYYSDCVIGGPGAFMIPVNDWTQFPEAVRRKLVLELAGQAPPTKAGEAAGRPPVVLAQGTVPADCMVGEKMWRDRNWQRDSR